MQRLSKKRDIFGAGQVAWLWQVVALVAFSVCACCWTGCRSTAKPPAARFASVEIQGNTPGQIHDIAVEVFQGSGYRVANTDLDVMIFEKRATRWSDFAYGDWGGDAPVWLRVRACIVPVSEARLRLQCQAYMIRDHGGSTEEEIACFRKRPFQKLMNEVSERLRGTATAKAR
jgi:hypothetical protein